MLHSCALVIVRLRLPNGGRIVERKAFIGHMPPLIAAASDHLIYVTSIFVFNTCHLSADDIGECEIAVRILIILC